MRRLLLPILLIVGSIASFRYSDERGALTATAVSASDSVPLTTPLLSARRVPEALDEPRARADLELELREISSRSPQLSCLVAQDSAGHELFAHNPDVGLVAASVQKLLTGTAALRQLGPEARLRTVVASTVDPVDGVIDGDLYLIGGGDPLLSTVDYLATFSAPFPHSRFEDLPDAIAAAGITQVNGAVVANEGRYDSERQPSSWDPEGALARDGFTGPLSTLMVNDGFESFPETRDPVTFPTPSADAAVHAAAVLDDLLEERGVAIAGPPRNEPELPADLIEVASLDSLPMVEMVGEMLAFSDNTTAELLLKEIGFSSGGVGSTDAGALAALEMVGAEGVDIAAVRVVDGSGLSDRNRLSCRAVVDMLALAGLDSDLGRGLAISGTSGTLIERYDRAPLREVVHAKTGSLSGVTALAGFVEGRAGEVVAFSYLINVESEITEELVGLQEALLLRLVAYPSGPPLADLEPLGTDRGPAAVYDPSSAPAAAPPETADEPDPQDGADLGPEG